MTKLFIPLVFLALWWFFRELKNRRQCPSCRVWVRPIPEEKRFLMWRRPTGFVQCPLCHHRWQEQYPTPPTESP